MVLQAQLGILDGRRVVGFLHCTHLHAPSGEPCRVRKQEAPLRGGGGESPPWPAPPLLAKFIHCPSRRESLGGLADQDGVGRGAKLGVQDADTGSSAPPRRGRAPALQTADGAPGLGRAVRGGEPPE